MEENGDQGNPGEVQPVRERTRREKARIFTGNVNARRTALAARRAALAQRAQRDRGRHRSVDAAFEIVERDAELGGGIIAAALAFRLFVWLLPLAFVMVGGLGLTAGAASESPEATAERVGLAGLVSNSVASAATGAANWYALLAGVPGLILATRSVLSVLLGSHRILWGDTRDAMPRATIRASVKLLLLLLAIMAVTGLGSTLRARAPGTGILATLLAMLPFGIIWLLISIDLPHRGGSWFRLIPGAILFAVGAEVIHVGTVYLLAPYAQSKQSTYGALGLAAALLLALYFVSRLMLGSAVLNATLWERKIRRQPASRTAS